MATLRLEVLGLSSQSPLINGISAALLEVSLIFAKFCQLVVTMRRISCVQAPQLGWHLSGVGSTLANSDFVDNIVSDLIEVISRQTGITMVEKNSANYRANCAGSLARGTSPSH